ncbi:MAG TPA: ABC transporter ATP-binding protein [Euzebyales bacterium]
MDTMPQPIARPRSSATQPAIRVHDLTKHYGATVGVEALDFDVPTGAVFGFLGPNGAGKTTTIRLLLGLLRATRGRALIGGHDVWADRRAVHRMVGYLPGDFVAYNDLAGRQYFEFLGDLRGGVSWPRVDELAQRLELDLGRRIGDLSSGNRQKVGLIQAFMHDPQVLVLDEPTSGLDPLMQRTFLALTREARDAGRTVFLSSHVLSEVEQIADAVGIVRDGRLVVVEEVASLKARAVRRLDLTFVRQPPLDALRAQRGVREVRGDGRRVHAVTEGSLEGLMRVAGDTGLENVVTHEADLEQIFLDYYTGEAS